MRVTGETNVLSERFGRGAVEDLGKEVGRFVVATMPIPWELAKERLGGTPEAVIHCESMEADVVEKQLDELPSCDTIVAIGGGQAVDLGKFFAWRRGVRLVTVPTILSVDAFVTPASAIRRNHRVEYVGKASPDPLVIDYDLVRTAPNELNVAGVGDIASNHTACWDWTLAQSAGHSEYPFSEEAVRIGREILSELMAHASEIRSCTDKGLQSIVDAYMRLNTVCLPAGHYRIEEGSEHYVFYELEERLGRPFIHGSIVGLGVYLMSRLQENEPERITEFMNEVGLAYQPTGMEIRRTDLEASLANLRSFVESRPNLWYTVINEREITPGWIADVLAGLQFS